MEKKFLIICLCFNLKESKAELISGFEFGDNKADRHYTENNGHVQFNVPVIKL